MIHRKNIFTLLLVLTALFSKSQDSLTNSLKIKARPNELGIDISSLLTILMGTQDYSGRYTNLTYRHWIADNHALRAFIGNNFQEETDPFSLPQNSGIIPGEQPLVYSTKVTTTPTNFQVGIGYEYLHGGRFKHGPGADLVYNNVYEKTEFFNVKVYESKDSTGMTTQQWDKLDSGAHVQVVNINKFGFNLGYSIRYQITKRWVISAGTMGSFRVSARSGPTGTIYNFDFDMVGIISDISLFYRF